MQYAILIYEPQGLYDDIDAERREAITAEYLALRERPGHVSGARLQPIEAATTLRASGGETLVTDGPFANTKEVFAGYFLFDVDNLDAALEIAADIPVLRMGGSVEVRPLVELPR